MAKDWIKKPKTIAPGFKWCGKCRVEKCESEFSPTSMRCRVCTSSDYLRRKGLDDEGIQTRANDLALHKIGFHRCSSCQKAKLLTPELFYKNASTRTTRTGFDTRCRLCCNEAQRITPTLEQEIENRRIEENRTLLITGRKRCIVCNDIKDVVDFHVSPDNASGYKAQCKTCRRMTRRDKNKLGASLADLESIGLIRCEACKRYWTDRYFERDDTGGRGRRCFECINIEIANAGAKAARVNAEAGRAQRKANKAAAVAHLAQTKTDAKAWRDLGALRCGKCRELKTARHFARNSNSCRVCTSAWRTSEATRKQRAAYARDYKKRPNVAPRIRLRSQFEKFRQRGGLVPITGGSRAWGRIKAAIHDAHGNRCCYCQAPDNALTIDHLDPISKGGTNDLWNLAPACAMCNSSKRDLPLEVFVHPIEADILRRIARAVAQRITGELVT